jgi:hypothetical protein
MAIVLMQKYGAKNILDQHLALSSAVRKGENIMMINWRIEVYNNGKTIIVERQYRGAGENWVMIDRYTTQDLHNRRKSIAPWVEKTFLLLSQDSANILPEKHDWEPDFSEGEPNPNDLTCGWCGLPFDDRRVHFATRIPPTEEELSEWLTTMDKEEPAEMPAFLFAKKDIYGTESSQ